MKLASKLGAEFLGTYRARVRRHRRRRAGRQVPRPAGGQNTGLGIGFLGVSLAFGLTVLTMAYAVGHISGGHFNPAITHRPGRRQAVRVEGRAPLRRHAGRRRHRGVGDAVGHRHQPEGHDEGQLLEAGGFAANGYGEHSPGHYNLVAGLVIEIVLTAVFLIVIMGTTDKRAPKGFAALAIGLALTLIHLVSIPVTNTSVNPARSTGPAILLASAARAGRWASCGCSGWRRSSVASSARSSTERWPVTTRSPTPASRAWNDLR